jgi:hypothetical protein
VLIKRKCSTKRKLNSDTRWLRGSNYKISGFLHFGTSLQLSEGVTSSILVEIGRAWVESEALGERIQDLQLSFQTNMRLSQGVGRQLWLFRVRYGVIKW